MLDEIEFHDFEEGRENLVFFEHNHEILIRNEFMRCPYGRVLCFSFKNKYYGNDLLIKKHRLIVFVNNHFKNLNELNKKILDFFC